MPPTQTDRHHGRGQPGDEFQLLVADGLWSCLRNDAGVRRQICQRVRGSQHLPAYGPGIEWRFNLTTSPASPLLGREALGSVCFVPESPHSDFVRMNLWDVFVPLYPDWTTTGIGNRSVFIANEPLLEAWWGTASERMLTLYGKANTDYTILASPEVAVPLPWSPAWSNTVPARLFIHTPVQGALSNASALFLDAVEQ